MDASCCDILVPGYKTMSNARIGLPGSFCILDIIWRVLHHYPHVTDKKTEASGVNAWHGISQEVDRLSKQRSL